MRFQYIVLFLISFLSYICSAQQAGYICVPVADLLLKPIHSKYKNSSSIAEEYENITLSPEKGYYACARAHQGLFNEMVTTVQEHGQEVQIKINNCFYNSSFHLQPQQKYWTLMSSIITYDELMQRQIPLEVFPTSFDYTKDISNEQIITLILPWYDEHSGLTFSAGTRFVYESNQDTTDAYGIVFYNPTTHHVQHVEVPHHICFHSYNCSKKDKQKIFVDILYRWTSFELSIPYVWGGISFTQLADDDFVLEQTIKNEETIWYWNRPLYDRPFTGFDCSGLILRAMQIIGIPYPYKNTTTIANHLKSLKKDETLEEGDLLWAPGHVMVIASLEQNELIEACGYGNGHGKVHNIALKDRFFELETFDDLLYAYHNRISLRSLNKDGKILSEIPHYHILKFSSIWKD